MAYSTIPKGSLYMNPKIYTGTGSSNAITGVGFQPDWTWIKRRNGTNGHNLYDVIRGVTKTINSATTAAESTSGSGLTAFGTDGFTVVSDGDVNGSGGTYVSWNWLANGTGSANTDGSISSTVSANTTSGFSIVSWTATNANGATIGHGLGTTPAIVITKRLNSTGDWLFGGSLVDTIRGGANSLLLLNTTSAMDNNSEVYQTFSPTTFQVGVNAGSFANGATLISYCFKDVQGYSKFSSYIGNGNADGTFVYTGFKPAFIMIKRTDVAADWEIYDNKRLGFNDNNPPLYANLTNVEGGNGRIDILSNGFKIRATSGNLGASGGTYIYMAFAENPFVATSGTNAIPVTAR